MNEEVLSEICRLLDEINERGKRHEQWSRERAELLGQELAEEKEREGA